MKTRMKVRRSTILWGTLLCIVFENGCICERKSLTPDDTIVVALESEPVNLDTRYATDANSQYIGQLINVSLVRFNRQAKVVPYLAKRWEILSPIHYRFFIFDNVVFHDGTKLTTKDIKATFENILDPTVQPPSPRSHGLKGVKSIDLIDDFTIDFVLNEPHAPFLGELSMGILPAKQLKSPKFHERLIGAGPYRFIKATSSSVRLARNDSFFAEKGKTNFIEFKIIKDANTRYLKLLEGSVDLVQNSLQKSKLQLLADKGFSIIKDKGLNTAYLGFNFKDNILKNQKVRQAVAFALNKKEIIKYELDGLADEANSILPPFSPYYAQEQFIYAEDLPKAKALLDQAGFKDPDGDGEEVRFTLTYKTFNDKTQIGIAKLIGAQLKRVGIGVNVVSFEWGTFYRDIKNGDFQLFSLRWVGFKDPDHYHYIFHSNSVPSATTSGGNRGRYANPEVDRLTLLARTEPIFERRKTHYQQLQKIVAEDLPYINLWHTHNFVVLQKNVKGFDLYPDGQLISLVKTTKSK